MIREHGTTTKTKAPFEFTSDDRAVTAIEYCLIGTFISLVLMVAIPNTFAALAPYFIAIGIAVGK